MKATPVLLAILLVYGCAQAPLDVRAMNCKPSDSVECIALRAKADRRYEKQQGMVVLMIHLKPGHGPVSYYLLNLKPLNRKKQTYPS